MANRQTGEQNGRTRGEHLVHGELIDEDGFMWRVLLPAKDKEHPERGIIVGPPGLEDMGLPDDLRRILHNQLYTRGLITASDLRGRGKEITAAIQATYKVDFTKVTGAYFVG